MPKIREVAEICAEIDAGEYCQVKTQLELDALALIKGGLGGLIGGNCPGIPVTVCNQVSLANIEAELLTILVEIQNLNLVTNEIELLLQQLIEEINSGAQATAVLSVLNDILIQLGDIEVDTTAIEEAIISVETTVITEMDQTQVLLSSILARLNAAECGDQPLGVTVCNQLDLSVVEASLDSILSSLVEIEGDTSAIEVLVGDLITEVQVGNANILPELQAILTALQSIDIDTTAIETAIASLELTVSTEGDQTQALLVEIRDRLLTDCTNPLKVEICNPEDIQIDLAQVVSLLEDVSAHLQTLVSNTDTLEAQIASLIVEVQSGNLTLDAVLVALGNITSFAQSIAENTDGLEQCCIDTQNLLQSEFDQSQALLQQVVDKPCCPTVVRQEICFDAGSGIEKGYEVAVYNSDGTLSSRYATDRNHTSSHATYTAVDCEPPEVVVIPQPSPVARLDTAPSGAPGVPQSVNVASNDVQCPSGQITTWVLVPGSNINCSVTGGANGLFDVTPTSPGPWNFQYEIFCDGNASGATADVSGFAITLSPPPGGNFTVLSFGAHFASLGDVQLLFDGDLNTGERLHQAALLELEFTSPYGPTDEIDMYWSNEQQPDNTDWMGLEFLFSADGGNTINHIAATPFESLPVTGNQWFNHAPGVPFNYIGIRSRLGENVGEDPILREFRINNIPN